jgi:Fe-S-cluster-containing dehydrogenase component/DMSO reductase anchor subunit
MTPLPPTGPPPGKPAAPRTLIDDLLDEQREMSAVEVFSRAHDRREIQTPRYRNLLPATAPAPGRQYAFEVDLDQCSGCKACVTACHSLNGLDEDETWRTVGRLTSKDWRAPLQQVVTTACHHCVDPGCLNGCPVLAYDKDPVTGIVRHLDDQCIGCQYCVMKCPYEVPQYSKSRGIVRKCDMCSSRLAVGEAPACVQACPNEAIRITVVEQDRVRGKYRGLPALSELGRGEKGKRGKGEFPPAPFPPFSSANLFLPDSPNPAITLPTTRYVSRRALPADLEAADAHEVRRSQAHPPLTLMLVLTQLGTGLALMNALAGAAAPMLAMVASAVTAIGVVVGTLHLGQPLKAWRSFLGWRKSWLSRELIAFGAFIGVLGIDVLVRHPFSAIIAALTALVAVACSAMAYVDTRRPFWNAPMTFEKFFGTTLLLGGAGALLLSALAPSLLLPQPLMIVVVVLGALFKLAVENRIYRSLVDEQDPHLTAVNKTALLLHGVFGKLSRVRVLCALAGGVAFPVFMLFTDAGVALAALALTLCFAGEIIERHLFFVAEVAPKMPGGRGA